MNDDDRWTEIARGGIEQGLGEEEGEDAIYDSAFALAYDALIDAECSENTASRIARQVAMCYAQP